MNFSFLLTHHFLILPVCFYAFAALLIVSAFMVIVSKHPVQSAPYLVLTFFAASGLWLIAEAESLGLFLILVYVGAVMILFLFVVMTVPVSDIASKQPQRKYLFLGVLTLVLFEGWMIKIIHPFTLIPNPLPVINTQLSNTHILGSRLYTEYLFPFEMSGLILLVAIIAAISLSTKYNRKKIITNPADQIKVTASTRLKIIKMTAEPKHAITPEEKIS